MKVFFALITVIALTGFQSQGQELSKRLQKEKAAFEAKIAAEEKYNELIKKADDAFRKDLYAEARALYSEAIQYNPKQEAWLTSKINDLDILMAERIAVLIDTVPMQMARVEEIEVETPPVEGDEIIQKVELGEPSISVKKEENAAVKVEPTPTPVEPAAIVAAQPEKPKVAIEPKTVYSKPKEVSTKDINKEYADYPFGITEETIDMKNHTIQRIVVVDSNEIIVYKRVKHSWGGDFTFKNDLSISQRIWLEEIEKYREKFGDK